VQTHAGPAAWRFLTSPLQSLHRLPRLRHHPLVLGIRIGEGIQERRVVVQGVFAAAGVRVEPAEPAVPDGVCSLKGGSGKRRDS